MMESKMLGLFLCVCVFVCFCFCFFFGGGFVFVFVCCCFFCLFVCFGGVPTYDVMKQIRLDMGNIHFQIKKYFFLSALFK